jgi:DNA-binding transcriptional LysR family regulator
MHAFTCVADLGGFALAARHLHLSPSAVTRLISSLEAHLGARLLHRTTRSLTLTDAGARYLTLARRILSDIADAEAITQAAQTTPCGRFSLTAPDTFGRLHVAPLLSEFLLQYPNITGEFTLCDRVVNLVEDGFDAAIRIGALPDSTCGARAIGSTRRVIVASPSYLRLHPRPYTPDDLSLHPIIHFTGLSPSPHWRFSSPSSLSSLPQAEDRVHLSPRFTTNSADAAITLAQQGCGLAMVLSYQAADAIRTKRLEVLLEAFEPPPLPIHILYPSQRLLSAKVRAFIDFALSTRAWHFSLHP